MKPSSIKILLLAILLSGCSSKDPAPVGANVRETPQQEMQKIQNDPKMPDGLKQIKLKDLQRQPGMVPSESK